mmetsp:Transcript_12485/g.38092  ORF Transcript_12485/g.38092 Transcript_12485/m.38092 type:complete len:126 (+) Transcript_12485:458-835(+)
MDRTLSWDEAKDEWRWYKTWRLPEISIEVSDSTLMRGKEVKLSTVCAGPQTGMTEVAMLDPEGRETPLYAYIVDGEARFSRVRITGTSSNFGGRKFHLLVSIVERREASRQVRVRAASNTPPSLR